MNLYEHIFMARQDVSSQQVDALVEQFKGVLENNGGKVGKIENWGLKVLPYRVKKNKKAHYALMNVTAPPDAIKEMERQMRLHEDVIRYLTVRVDEHEEGPSAMLRKNEREERGQKDDEDSVDTKHDRGMPEVEEVGDMPEIKDAGVNEAEPEVKPKAEAGKPETTDEAGGEAKVADETKTEKE